MVESRLKYYLGFHLNIWNLLQQRKLWLNTPRGQIRQNLGWGLSTRTGDHWLQSCHPEGCLLLQRKRMATGYLCFFFFFLVWPQKICQYLSLFPNKAEVLPGVSYKCECLRCFCYKSFNREEPLRLPKYSSLIGRLIKCFQVLLKKLSSRRSTTWPKGICFPVLSTHTHLLGGS